MTDTPASPPPPDAPALPVMDKPYEPPAPVGPRARMRGPGLSAPFVWLARGWRDLMRCPGLGLFYGLCFWVMAQVLALVFRHSPEYTLSIISGCLLVGPFLAMGLYEASRRCEIGEKPSLPASLTCWGGHLKSMALLVLVLLVLELLWGRASLVVFAVFFNTGMPSTTGVIEAVFNPANLEFLLVYLAVGGVFAALVFATSVVSIPMILDRDTDAISAGITSIRVVLGSPLVMLLWGALLSVLVMAALWPWALGIIVVGPWLGHASWHAYRGTVDWDEAPDAQA